MVRFVRDAAVYAWVLSGSFGYPTRVRFQRKQGQQKWVSIGDPPVPAFVPPPTGNKRPHSPLRSEECKAPTTPNRTTRKQPTTPTADRAYFGRQPTTPPPSRPCPSTPIVCPGTPVACPGTPNPQTPRMRIYGKQPNPGTPNPATALDFGPATPGQATTSPGTPTPQTPRTALAVVGGPVLHAPAAPGPATTSRGTPQTPSKRLTSKTSPPSKPEPRSGKKQAIRLEAVVEQFEALLERNHKGAEKALLTLYGPGTTGLPSTDGRVLHQGQVGRWATSCAAQGWRNLSKETLKKYDELPSHIKSVLNLPVKGRQAMAGVPQSVQDALDKLLTQRCAGGGDPHRLLAEDLDLSNVQASLTAVRHLCLSQGGTVAPPIEDSATGAVECAAATGPVPSDVKPVSLRTTQRWATKYGWAKCSQKKPGKYLPYEHKSMQRRTVVWSCVLFALLFTCPFLCRPEGQRKCFAVVVTSGGSPR